MLQGSASGGNERRMGWRIVLRTKGGDVVVQWPEDWLPKRLELVEDGERVAYEAWRQEGTQWLYCRQQAN